MNKGSSKEWLGLIEGGVQVNRDRNLFCSCLGIEYAIILLDNKHVRYYTKVMQ